MIATLPVHHAIDGNSSGPVARVAETLRLELVESTEGLLGLERDWKRLANCCSTKTPFLKWDWVMLWWQTFADRFQLVIGVVRDRSTNLVQGIAPLVLGHQSSGPRACLKQLGFLGGLAEVASEGMDFLIEAGEESQVAPLLAGVFAATRSRWDAVHLQMMHAESPNVRCILEALQACSNGATVLNQSESRYIVVPQSLEAYTKLRSPNWRSQDKRKAQRFLTVHNGRVLLAGQDMDLDQAFDELLRCHTLQWSTGVSHFGRPVPIAFHRQLIKRWVEQGRAMVMLLEMDGQIGAACYCMLSDGKVWYYQSGWDSRYQKISAGQILVRETLKWAITHQMETVEMLPGDSDYKRRWAKHSRQVLDLECFNPYSLKAQSFRLTRGLKRCLTGWKKATPEPERENA